MRISPPPWRRPILPPDENIVKFYDGPHEKFTPIHNAILIIDQDGYL